MFSENSMRGVRRVRGVVAVIIGAMLVACSTLGSLATKMKM